MAVLAAVVCFWALAPNAQAQWAWRDAAGNITYSDAPPPAEVQPGNIIRQPLAPAPEPANPNSGAGGYGSGGSYSSGGAEPRGANAPVPATEASRQAPAAPAAPAKSLAEQDAEFRKRIAERQKAAQKAEQDEAEASQKSAACAQARGYLDVIQSGTRIMRPDAEGNRNFLDDEQRAAEIQKTQENVAKYCS